MNMSEVTWTRKNRPSSEKSTDEEREFTVNLGDDGKEHVLKGRFHDNVYTALRAAKDVCARMDKAKGKEICLIGRKGIEGCINRGMPLQYMPEGSQFEMKFYKRSKGAGAPGYRQYTNKGKKCILFYVAPSGSRFETHGAQSRRIISCKQLLSQRCMLCVFAPKGETIKDALCKDGRFLPVLEEKDWVLMEDKKSIDNAYLVNNLSNKNFCVEILTERRGRRSDGPNNEQLPLVSCEGQPQTSHYFKHDLLELYPALKEQGDFIDTFLGKKKRKKPEDLIKVYFGKELRDSILIKKVKTLAIRSESVGFIEWSNNGNGGSATCFVLCGRYILTCHHVVKMIVGKGIEEKDWALTISRSSRVTFSYEDKHPKENDWLLLEPWFKISDEELDFAVLKLQEKGSASRLPPGLVQLSNPPPFNGLVHIIGHPEGQAKSMDDCSVVTVCNRQQECTRRFCLQKDPECNNFNCGYNAMGNNCIHMYNPKDFSKVINNPDVVTYDTSFFHGSSGSPVFDANGHLVALHTAGYFYGGKLKQHSIIEFGSAVTSVCSVMKKKYASWYASEIGPAIQAGPDAGEVTCAASTDVEMEVLD